MKKEVKMLAYNAISDNVEDTTARTIIKYVMECELFGQDIISPTNNYLATKFGWKIETVRVAISKAKKSQFITTTGKRNNRCFELNVGHLKGKMAEINQKKPLKSDLFEVLERGLNLSLPNDVPNDVPNDRFLKNGSSKVNLDTFLLDNNNNNNNNINKEKIYKKEKNISDENEIENISVPRDVVKKRKVPEKEKKKKDSDMLSSENFPKNPFCDDNGVLLTKKVPKYEPGSRYGIEQSIEDEQAMTEEIARLQKEVADDYKKTEKKKSKLNSLDFEEGFYQYYPLKRSKARSKMLFNKLKDSEKKYVCKAVHDYIKSEDVLKRIETGEKRFLPHPSTWLNQRRWEDEEPPTEEKELTKSQLKQIIHDGAMEDFADPRVDNDMIPGRASTALMKLIGGSQGLSITNFLEEVVPELKPYIGKLV